MIETNVCYNSPCGDVMASMPDNCIDTIITDPPYGIRFKGNKWDYKLPDMEDVKSMLRVLKPGGTILCFGGTRTYHRMAVLLEDCGFYISDMICWLYGQGFPKSVDISYMIDKKINKTMGEETQKMVVGNPMGDDADRREISVTLPACDNSKEWYGWGTALKPAWEPVIVANKHIVGNYEDNALEYGVAGYWIDGARIGDESFGIKRTSNGRWPTNVIHDGIISEDKYFYCAKPSIKEREGISHPTQKPEALIEYFCRLTRTPSGGIVFDPYAGSFTTAVSAIRTNRKYIVCETEKPYFDEGVLRINKEHATITEQGELF